MPLTEEWLESLNTNSKKKELSVRTSASNNGKKKNKDIKELDLSKNKLTHLQVEIGQLKQLTRLDLHNNKLTHLPVEIGKLTLLTKLDLSFNQLTHLPIEIGQLTQLTILKQLCHILNQILILVVNVKI